MTKTFKLLLPATVLSVLAGIISAFIRTGKMFKSPYPASYIYFIFICAAIGIACFFIARASAAEGRENLAAYDSEDSIKKSFASHTPPVTVLLLTAAAMLLIAFIRSLTTVFGSTLGKINIVFVLLCTAAFVIRAINREQSEKTGILSLFPVYYLCIYLLIFYRDNAKGADLDVYGPHALTIAILIFASYFNAAVKFDRRPPLLRFMFSLAAVFAWTGDTVSYLMLRSTLTSADPAFYIMLTGGFALYFAVSLYTIPLKLFKITKPDKKKKDQPSDEDTAPEQNNA